MRDKLLKLEKTSRLLEPTPEKRKAVRDKVVQYGEDFLNKIETSKAFEANSDKGLGLLDHPIGGKPLSITQALNLVKKNVDFPALNPASGGHLGYIPGGGIYYSSLGDYLTAITNRYAAIFYASPGAVRMENMLIDWMANLVGYPKNTVGNLTSGGSIANLIAICTARDAKNITSKNLPKSVIYMTAQTHHSLNKAFRIAGLNECLIRYIEMDSHCRMDAKDLRTQILADKKKKLNPFLVVGSAGTTDTGAIDPLEDIGNIAKRHKLWYHIDAAYGGFFILTREGKRKLKGLDKSDSLVIDPHKGLFLPYGVGTVLVKNKKHLNATHHYLANYMQDTLSAMEEPSPADLSPELTKHFRGLRMWLPLQLLGIKPFKACLEEKLLLAKYFYKEVRKLGFETGTKPELSVVTFRYKLKHGDQDKFNQKLLEFIKEDGRTFVSSTNLDGKFTMRFACLSFRTHLSTVDSLLTVLKKGVKKLEE